MKYKLNNSIYTSLKSILKSKKILLNNYGVIIRISKLNMKNKIIKFNLLFPRLNWKNKNTLKENIFLN
jgi:hypothetical protein